MSVSGGTGSRARTHKDKQNAQIAKADTNATKTKVQQQATPEQIRLAQMIDNSDDSAVVQKIQQLVELTGKSPDEVAVALHDALNDLDEAYLLLIEGESANKSEWQEGGKKKKQRASQQQQQQQQQQPEMMNHTGDGRTRQQDNQDKENDRPDVSRRTRRNDTRPPRLSRGRGRERGAGGEYSGNVDGETEGRTRGRGRGRGPRGAGRGGNRSSAPRFNDGAFENNRPYRGGFDSTPPATDDQGPQIDLWTNETAENAQKEMGEPDWADDIWTGGLEESKVFVGNSSPPPEELMAEPNVSANSQGQRIDLRELLPDTSALPDNYMVSPQLDANSYLVNADTAGYLNDAAANFMVGQDSGGYMMATPGDGGLDSQYINQLKEATESIKNSIGIGSGSRQGLGSVSPLVSSGPPGLMTNMSSSPPGLSQSTQRSKPQRSRMPAPSKIPASAVEMPGHQLSSVDVQFGSDSFVFGAPTEPSPGYQHNRPAAMPNNIDQVAAIKSNDSAITNAILSSGQPGSLGGVRDPSSQRSIYNSPYPMTVTPEQQLLPQISSPPEPIPFPSMQADRSPSTQRSNHTPNSLIHGSLTNQGDVSLTAGFTQTSAYSSSPAFTHATSNITPNTQYNLAPAANQFATPVSQYGVTQNQYAASTSQFASGAAQNQYLSSTTGPGYHQPAAASSFQSQSATNLYTNQSPTSQTSSYAAPTQASAGFHDGQQQTASYKTPPATQAYDQSLAASMGSAFAQRDTGTFSAGGARSDQSAGYGEPSNYGASRAQRNYSRDQQPGAYNASSTTGGYLRSDTLSNQAAYGRDGYTRDSFSRDGQTSGALGSYSREHSGAYPRDSPAAYQRESTHSASGPYARDITAPANTPAYGRDMTQTNAQGYSRDLTSTNTPAYNRDNAQSNTQAYSRDAATNAVPYTRDLTPANTAYTRDSASANQTSSFNRDSSYQRDATTQAGTFSARDSSTVYTQSQTDPAYSLDTQSSGTYARDSYGSQAAYGASTQSAFTAQTTTHGATTSNAFNAQTQQQQQASSKIGGYASQMQNSTLNYGASQLAASQAATDIALPASTTSTTKSALYGGQGAGYASSQTQNVATYGAQTPSAQSAGYAAQLQNNAYGAAYCGSQAHNSPFNATQSYTQSQYNAQAFPTSPHNKLPDSFAKLGVKDAPVSDLSTSPVATVTTAAAYNATSTISTSTLSSASSTVQSTNVKSSLPTSTKASNNLLHSMPMLNTQYIMPGQTSMPSYFPHVYPTTYEELQVLQQGRAMPLGNYYDMNFASPTTLTGRDQNSLANSPYSGAGEGKVNRVDTQSPVPASQTQPTQSHQQTFMNPPGIPPGYSFYPSYMLPGTNFQYAQTMFMPPVTNTAPHAASSAAGLQYQKAYTSHGYGTNKSYDEMNHTPDFVKAAYPSQTKVSATSGTSGVADMTGAAPYAKTHTPQAFEKQALHTATQSPFSLPGMPTGSQMGAITNPYGYMNMMPHSQFIHHQLQQDGGGSSRGTQQAGSVGKSGVTKGYPYWNN